jgi:ATP-dependent DNA helicase PIF1
MSNQDRPISIVPNGPTSDWPRKKETFTEVLNDGVLPNYQYQQQEVPEEFDPELFAQISSRTDDALEGNLPDIELDSKGEVVFSFPPEIRQQLHKRFAFVTGKAGTGKSTLLRLEDENRPDYIEKASTTGIAAINCGGRTINSLLKYFNTESLERSYKSGKLHYHLRNIRAKKKVLGIDEVSMMDAKQLDIILTALDDIAQDDMDDESRNGKFHDLGLHLIGDFCQLPPVNAEFAFKSQYWKEYFEPNIVKLETIWRQDDEEFINAINFMRAGKGKEAVKFLKKAGVEFTSKLDNHFNGTTLIPNNRDVDSYNAKRLGELSTPLIRYAPIRRGSQDKAWDRNSKGEWGIPFEQRFKLGAYVMILRNDTKNFTYVNGDCGEIVSFDKNTNTFGVKLVRNNQIVSISPYIQFNYQYEQPSEGQFNSMFLPYQDSLTGHWVVGSIQWIPLRLAYASTTHKSQGLSLDKVQIDSRPDFYGYPSMAYVSVSRCKTPQGLVIVGNEYDFSSKVCTNKDVLKWV